MQKFAVAMLMLAVLTACTSKYGNYAKISDADNVQIADDTAHKLTALYPPASTHLVLSQEAQDAYGQALVKKLHENGYALRDSNSPSDSTFFAFLSASHNDKAAPAIADKSLHYVVDQLGENLYRVTLNVDSQTLSRVYHVSSNGLAPAGAWTRRE